MRIVSVGSGEDEHSGEEFCSERFLQRQDWPWIGKAKAVVTTTIRPRYGHSTTNITTGLLHCGLNKYINRSAVSGLRHCDLNGHFDKQSNGRRIEVESSL